MPTILFIAGFRFFFYSNEQGEPIHIDVEKAEGIGKIWLEPEIKVADLQHFSDKDKCRIMALDISNVALIKTKWNEHFNQ